MTVVDTPEDFACRVERHLKVHTSPIDYDHCELIEIVRVYRDAVRREAFAEAAALVDQHAPGDIIWRIEELAGAGKP